jgi:hypothetical protein
LTAKQYEGREIYGKHRDRDGRRQAKELGREIESGWNDDHPKG